MPPALPSPQRRVPCRLLPSAGLLAVAVAAAPVALAAPPIDAIRPHRAVYDLDLAGGRSQPVVVDVAGTMTFSLQDVCDGWIVEQTYDTQILYASGPDVRWRTSYSTWESRDGRELTFALDSSSGELIQSELRGEASLDSDKGGTARLRRPSAETIALPPGTLFPTYFAAELIAAIRDGASMFTGTLYAGTEETGPEYVAAIIGRPVDAPPSLDDPLLEGPSHRIVTAYYPPAVAAELPSVEVTMRFYENGVSDDVVLAYSDFGIRARLVEIEALPVPDCR